MIAYQTPANTTTRESKSGDNHRRRWTAIKPPLVNFSLTMELPLTLILLK